MFDFTVSINVVGEMTISYEITADKDLTSTLANDEVRLYLQRSTDGINYSDEVLTPSKYTPLDQKDEFGAKVGEMVLDRGLVTDTTIYYYRLRMWVDSSYQVTDRVKYFRIKVNVYGKDGGYTEEVKNNVNIVGAYTYDGKCFSGKEDTCEKTDCYEDRSVNSCSAGTIVRYRVNNNEEKIFNVLDDKGDTIILQQAENTVNNVVWYEDGDDNSRGPLTALAALENATSNWVNVNNQTYEMGKTIFKDNPYTDCDSSISCTMNKYTLPSRTVRARMITVQEARAFGCVISTNSCPKWLYNGLSSSDNNYGYWTMNSYSLNAAWCIGYVGFLNGEESRIDFTGYGVRAVVEISK